MPGATGHGPLTRLVYGQGTLAHLPVAVAGNKSERGLVRNRRELLSGVGAARFRRGAHELCGAGWQLFVHRLPAVQLDVQLGLLFSYRCSLYSVVRLRLIHTFFLTLANCFLAY